MASKKNTSGWRSVRMPQRQQVARTLQQRYSLRWHGLLIGSFTLVLMWCASHLQMLLGVETLALRYLVTLTARAALPTRWPPSTPPRKTCPASAA